MSERDRPSGGGMPAEKDLEAALRLMLREEAPQRAPDELVRAVKRGVRGSPQRRRWILPWNAGGRVDQFVAVAASGAAIVAVVAVLLGVLGLRERDPIGVQPTAPPTLDASPVPANNLLRAPVIAAGSLWVPQGSGTILRVDMESGRVTAAIPGGDSVSGAMVVHDDGVWVGAQEGGTWGVVRVDPSTNTVAERIPLGRQPTAMSIAGDSLWIASSATGTVLKLDLVTRVVVHEVTGLINVAAIAAAEDGVWVSMLGTGRAARIDPVTHEVRFLDPQPNVLQLPPQTGVALTDEEVWVTGLTPRQTVVYSRANGELVDRVNLQQPISIARAGNTMWILDGAYDVTTRDPRVVGIAVASREIVGQIPLGDVRLADGLTASENAVWVVNNGTLRRLDVQP